MRSEKGDDEARPMVAVVGEQRKVSRVFNGSHGPEIYEGGGKSDVNVGFGKIGAGRCYPNQPRDMGE